MHINGWIDKQIVIYTDSRILFSHKKQWSTDSCYNVNDSQSIMLSEGSKTQKDKSSWLHLYEIPKIGKSIDIEYRLVVSRDKGKEIYMYI